jgi:hypothetical protein
MQADADCGPYFVFPMTAMSNLRSAKTLNVHNPHLFGSRVI